MTESLLTEFRGRVVVIDVQSMFVYVGTLSGFDPLHLELTAADVHDLRDSNTSREKYVIESKTLGVRSNRKRVVVRREQVVSVSLLDDVIE